MVLDFVQSRKGKPCLIIDGQRYYRKAEKKGRTYWMCIRRGRCQSTAITQGSVLLASKPHNHDLMGNDLPGGAAIMKRLSTTRFPVESVSYPFVTAVLGRENYGVGSSSSQYDESLSVLPSGQSTYEDDESLLCEAEEIEEKYTPCVELYESQPGTSSDAESANLSSVKRSHEDGESTSSKKGKCDIIADEEPEDIMVTVDAERIPSPQITITKTTSLSSEGWTPASNSITEVVSTSKKGRTYNPRFSITKDFDVEERRTLLELEKRRIEIEERRLQMEEEERRRRIELDERRLIVEEEKQKSKREIERKKLELEERRVSLMEKRIEPEISHWKKIDNFMQETKTLFGKIISSIGKLQESKISEKMMEVISKVLDKQHNLMEVITNGDDQKRKPKSSQKRNLSSRPLTPSKQHIVNNSTDKPPGFTTEEMNCLIEGVQEHLNVIQKDDSPEELRVAWTFISEKVNDVNKDTRKTADEVKHKWLSFKNSTKTKAMRTLSNLSELEMKVMDMISMEEMEADVDAEDSSLSPKHFEKRRRISEISSSSCS